MARLDPESLATHVDRLYRAAWALCGSPHDAEDLVQETFARVLARPRILRGVQLPRRAELRSQQGLDAAELAYLMRALRNTFLSSRRTASRRPQVTATLADFEAPDPRLINRPEHALEAQELYAAIAELPEDFRLTLVAVDIVGLSYAEAGRVLDAPEATITTRLHRARRKVVASIDAPAPVASRPPSRATGSIDTVTESLLDAQNA